MDKIAEIKAEEIARELSLGLIGVKKGTEAILALIEQEQKPMVEALRFVVDRENLTFAECSDAEEIISVCKKALDTVREGK